MYKSNIHQNNIGSFALFLIIDETETFNLLIN